MAASIEDLTKNLKSGCKDVEELLKSFKYTSESFNNDEQFKLMTKKEFIPMII